MTVGVTAQAAAPMSVPARSGAAVEGEQLGDGGSGWLPVLIAALAVISIMIFQGDGDDDPVSP